MAEPVNLLLITADQLRADSLGCYGNAVVRTPAIDAIAAEGVCFDRVFAASPICGPNRASLVTGRYPSVHGLRTSGRSLPAGEVTMMEVLREHGYATFASGKMHLDPQWSAPPPPEGAAGRDPSLLSPEQAIDPQPKPGEMPWRGFEEVWITEDHRVGPYAAYLRERGFDPWADPHSATFPQHQCVRSAYPEEHYQTTWIANRAVDWLRDREDGRPFFCWVSFVDPHHPFALPEPWDTLYDPAAMPPPAWREGEAERWPARYRRKHLAEQGSHEAIGMHRLSEAEWARIKAYYYGAISLIDKQVGRLVAALRERGELERTVVVFTSDHGELLGDHHLMFKGTHHEVVTRVPVVLKGPGILGAGTPGVGIPGAGRREALCSTIDLMPTLLQLAGVEMPAGRQGLAGVQGRSMVPLLDDAGAAWREDVLIESDGLMRTLRTADARLTWHGAGETGELFDLKADPLEQWNLWDEPAFAGERAVLLDRLMLAMVEAADPLPPRTGVW